MIRKANPKDFDFVYQLYMHPLVNPYLLYESMDADKFRPVFTDLLEKGVKYIYINDGLEAGMFKWIPLSFRMSHVAYLGGLAIHPSFAGKGLGQQMLEEILNFGKQHGFKRIELSVAATNEKAIHLYGKMGFEKEGFLKKYSYLEKEHKYLDEVLMAYLFE